MRKAVSAALAAVVVAALPRPGRAGDDTEARARTPHPGPARRAAAVAASLVPGVLVHGSGLYTAGDPVGARRLLAMESIGLGMTLAGGVPLVVSGASRKLIWPAAPLVVSGLGVLAVSWLADIYGASGLSEIAADDPRPPPVELELGYAYVDDAIFDYRSFVVGRARAYLGRTVVEPSAWVAADDDNQRLRLDVRYQLLGATPYRWRRDVSRLEVGGAATYLRYGSEDFDSRVGEVFVGGRFDFGELSPALHGAYLQLSTGVGLQWLHYRFDGNLSDQDDVAAELLGTFGLGIRLGTLGRLDGEVYVGYDHRRDDYAAGLSLPHRGSGFPGHVVGRASGFAGSWGLVMGVAIGGARVVRLSLARRLGGMW